MDFLSIYQEQTLLSYLYVPAVQSTGIIGLCQMSHDLGFAVSLFPEPTFLLGGIFQSDCAVPLCSSLCDFLD